MHTVDRRGVHIDQCTGCRGIFLDRGELEQMSNAEHSHYGPVGAPGHYSDSPPPYGRRHDGHDPRYQSNHYQDSPPPYGHHGGHHGGQKRRKGFLEGLFD
jgi:uncharacterized protein